MDPNTSYVAGEKPQNGDDDNISRQEFEKLLHGCEHYRRRCKLRAHCCDKIFTCRHCHNEATITKKQFHCDDCGICRVGGWENFFHCPNCGSCYSMGLRHNHRCVQDSMKCHCPICYEFLFDSTKVTFILKCGHTMHKECYEEMLSQNQYRCPICSKSVFNMSETWEMLDQEIEATAMPEECRYEVSVLCNDCNNTSKTSFHILGHKCSHCGSYNTRVITSGENDQ